MKHRTLLVFLAGVAMGIGATYVLWHQMHGASLITANKARNFQAEQTADRPWAQPLTCPGVPNFHRVSPALYHGAQPTAEGMKNLEAMGIKTIVNLRTLHGDRDEIGPSGSATVTDPR
ncbi:MAG: hypothetical protein HQ546_04615 [Planctomycetes bacterium]|nr:hypothetical protein [Planctomycetota bacterium]